MSLCEPVFLFTVLRAAEFYTAPSPTLVCMQAVNAAWSDFTGWLGWARALSPSSQCLQAGRRGGGGVGGWGGLSLSLLLQVGQLSGVIRAVTSHWSTMHLTAQTFCLIVRSVPVAGDSLPPPPTPTPHLTRKHRVQNTLQCS